MSVSPTTGMSRLSLEATTPTAHDRIITQSTLSSPTMPDQDPSSEESEWDDDEDDEDQDSNKHIVTSPTGLQYNISQLSHKTQQVVRGLFNQTFAQGPPQISLELCGIKEEDDEDSSVFYAFQLHEVVPCSVRIGSRKSKRFSTPKCECLDARYRNLRPCKHLIWLFDRISKQTLFDHDPESELILTEAGYPAEMGDIFEQISQTRLDVLADSLHCDISDADSNSAPPSPSRVREARELVAALAGVQSWELDGYRPDLSTDYDHNTLIRRGDLEATLFSLLLNSHSLAEWVRSELEPSDPAVDPFRNIQHQVSRIITELEAYSSALRDESASNIHHHHGKDAEGPRNVPWAATQIQHRARKIEKLVSRGVSPLSEHARASAARALVGILKSVVNQNVDSHAGDTVDDRNLYMRLIGNHDTGFVYSILELLVDQSQFVEELEGVMDLLGRYGAPTTYVSNMRNLIARMRHHKADDSSVSAASGIPRADTPPIPMGEPPQVLEPLEETQTEPARHPQTPISAGSPQFLTPELPASSTARGSRGTRGRPRGRGRSTRSSSVAAGSKRSVSQGSVQDSPKAAKKRARGG
ncbi:hypothetical protein QBC38DRAFT_204944 [Podospora fimiseda]|uniref:SWIM-type domain-containing protein n=1 Tax=Podospora fimiseda TaxID=252190 RepID=A0AAN7BYH0_9PEZI|nr:hypothetical protein QBC38DRAFT_204944 [Podospora fimiseda]